jgi:hypothetical protein
MGMSDDGETLVCHRVPVIQRGELCGFVNIGLTPRLCPHCPDVHLDVQLGEDGTEFGIRLDVEDAEKLAYKLLNPPAVDG